MSSYVVLRHLLLGHLFVAEKPITRYSVLEISYTYGITDGGDKAQRAAAAGSRKFSAHQTVS
jgi:hypothetical protein